MISIKKRRPYIFIFIVLMIGTTFVGVSYSQDSKDLSVVGPVVAVETPEFSWPMEFEAIKIFYVRVDKVLKGKFDDKYVRIGYGYNPSRSPQNNLPTELFNGKTVWKFNVSKMSGFEQDTLPTIKTQSERMAELEESDGFIAAPVKSEPDADDKEDFYKVVKIVPGYYACILTPGFEAEKVGLTSMKNIKSYWLDLPFSSGLKLVRSSK